MNREELVKELFEEFDTNRDGVLSRGEFVELVRCLFGEHGVATSREIFDQFDANHDNVISRDELVNLVIDHAI